MTARALGIPTRSWVLLLAQQMLSPSQPSPQTEWIVSDVVSVRRICTPPRGSVLQPSGPSTSSGGMFVSVYFYVFVLDFKKLRGKELTASEY